MDITSTRLEKKQILENVDLLVKRIGKLDYVKTCIAKETLELSYVRFVIHFENGSKKTFKECVFSLTPEMLESIYSRIKSYNN